MAQLSSGLYVKPIGRSSGGLTHVLSVNAAGFNGHVRSARKSRLSSGVGSRHVCSVAAVDSLVIEETVDGHAVLEQPGSLPSSQFEAFDQATNLVEDLETLNAQMAELITKASIAVEVQQETSKWAGNTLPSDTYAAFKRVFREDRKKVEQENKANRRLKRVMRAAGSSLAQPSSPQQSFPDTFLTAEQQLLTQQQLPASAMEQQQIADSQIQSLDAIKRRAKRAQQREQRSQSAAPAAPPVQQAALDQQPQRASLSRVQRLPQPAVQQPAGRSRRRRGSSSVAAAAATPAGQASSSSTSSLQELELPAQQEATASRGSPVGPRPAPARAIDAPPQANAMTAVRSSPAGLVQSTISSSSNCLDSSPHGASSSNSPAVAPRRQAARGFQPLSLQQSSLAAPVRSSMSSRTARAFGISARSRATATASAAAAAAGSLEVASNLPKLVDNNMHGLDMRMDLLSAEQEKELAVMVQDLLKLEDKQRELTQQLGRPPTDMEWMEAVGAGPKDDSDEEYKAAAHTFQARLKHGRTAKQVMISANYKLVVAITRKYQGYGMSANDLINEGIAGLVKGVERFEPSKGCKFSTYAHWWIRQAITRSLSDQGRLVRLPAHLQEMLTKMTKVSRTFEGQYGREPTLDELARELGLEPSKIQDAYEAVFTPRSLDAPMADGEGATLGDVIEDERMLDAEDTAYMESLKADLEAVLLTLPPREAGVLRMRFGLLDGTEHTLDDIGAQYKVTRERIRQIEAKAIRQLRSRQSQPGSVMADYQLGGMEAKELASRTSSGTKKQG